MPLRAPRVFRYVLLSLVVLLVVLLLFNKTGKLDSLADVPMILHRADSILFQELKSLEDQGPLPVEGYAGNSKGARTFTQEAFDPGTNYTRTVVVGRKRAEKIDWLHEQLPNEQTAIYVVDDSHAPLHPPENKGNEVMVHLSYIIDHYDALPDVAVFIHAHRFAWHNNDLLGSDTALMLKYLRSERVIREGYVNLRCQWYPGCPGWLRPNAEKEDEEKKEEMYVAKAWGELFPGEPLPEVLGQPCCSQFALSRDRMRQVPVDEYRRLRRWLLKTKIRNTMSGRVFEYLWQYLFTGQHVLCPSIHVCYCDGYGACFEDEDRFQEWFKGRFYIRQNEWELEGWQENEEKYKKAIGEGRASVAERVERPPPGRVDELKLSVDQRWIELDAKGEEALARGTDPKWRAKIAGRPWTDDTNT